MLDMGFIRDIRRILALLPAKRQNLLFSATFSDEIRRLADGLLNAPVAIEVARRNADCELVSQRVHPVAQDRKRHALAHLVRSGGWQQVLVFTRTKHGANRLADQLDREGISATAIHGNKSQPQRLKALAEFKQGAVRVLVATDIAARGLDIEALPHVVNFDLPHVAEDYVHRIGRTGRAGASGEAISLVSPEERSELAAIEKLIGRRIERLPVPGWEPAQAPASTPLPAQERARPSGARTPADRARRPVEAGVRRQEQRQQQPRFERRLEGKAPRAHPGGHAATARATMPHELRRPNAPRPQAPASTSAQRSVGALLGALPPAADERS
jgi:ATP-dependent RNA helicase RhlE